MNVYYIGEHSGDNAEYVFVYGIYELYIVRMCAQQHRTAWNIQTENVAETLNLWCNTNLETEN